MSEKFAIQAIEHLKSGLALSSHVGCPLNCAYCLLFAGNPDGHRVETVASEETLVQQLLQPDSLFLNGMTPLFLNNRTDPLLPEVRNHTFRIMDLLVENGIRSPVILISKLFPQNTLRSYFDHLPLLFFFSYSLLEDEYNYNDICGIDRISQVVPAERLFHYMRPIIPGKNDDPLRLCAVVRQFADAGFAGSIVSGVRVTFGNADYIGSIPGVNGSHKVFSPSIYRSLLSDPELARRGYPLFRHTSCAIDSFMGRANRLGYYLQDAHCNRACKNRQHCAVPYFITPDICARIAQRFPGMKYVLDQEGILIQSPVSQEVTAFLRNAFGIPVKADTLLLSPSEEVLTHGPSAADRL